jgi:RNA polymerase sigma factor (sigma-70 family)
MEPLVVSAVEFGGDFTHHGGSGSGSESRTDELTALGLAAASGSQRAYEMLVNREEFLERLTKASKWVCRGSTIQAEELLSEFFLRFPKKIRKYSNRNGASILSWSSLVLRHLHIDLLRRKWREDDRVEHLDLLPAKCERTIDTPDTRAALNQAFNRLTEREKKLLALRWREETLDDIVAAIDNLSDPRDIRNRRPKISKELTAVEQKLRQALDCMNTGQLQGGPSGPLKADY